MRVQLADTVRDSERSFRLIDLHSRLPQAEIRRLQQIQADNNAALKKLIAEKDVLQDAVLNVLTTSDDGPVASEADVIQRVDKLIGKTK